MTIANSGNTKWGSITVPLTSRIFTHVNSADIKFGWKGFFEPCSFPTFSNIFFFKLSSFSGKEWFGLRFRASVMTMANSGNTKGASITVPLTSRRFTHVSSTKIKLGWKGFFKQVRQKRKRKRKLVHFLLSPTFFSLNCQVSVEKNGLGYDSE